MKPNSFTTPNTPCTFWWFGLLACIYILHIKFWLKESNSNNHDANIHGANILEGIFSESDNELEYHVKPLSSGSSSELSKVDRVGISTKNYPINADTDNNISFRCEVIQRSHLYSKACGNIGSSPSERRPLLITGTGRSGTDFVHTLLTKLGLKLSHDVRGPAKHGGVSWPEAFNEKKCKHPHWNWKSADGYGPFGGSNRGKYYTFDHVFHLVRHPLKQLLSRANNGEWVSSENRKVTACNTISDEGLNETETRLNRALSLTLRHWVLYNSFIEQYAEWRFRVEQFNEQKDYILDQIFTRTGFNLPTEQKQNASKVSTHKNAGHTRKPKGLSLTWKFLHDLDPIYAEMCQAMSLKYGYEIDETDIYPNVREVCDGNTTITADVSCFFRKKDRKWMCDLDKKLCPL